ncbi:MAG: protein kinase, partial [Chloroflexota bacterium]|nr:protein kinase [Chloroflexota bacterium]
MDDSDTHTARLLADRYELGERIGAGSITAVFRATDRTEQRTVAVKLLHRQLAASETARTRFRQQAERASRLAHDHLIPIYDLGEEQGCPYLVEEYLPGGSLGEYIARAAPLPLDEALNLTHDIAIGVGHAHSRGLIHGDLRPSDILFTTDHRPKVGDFGLAVVAAGEQSQPDAAGARPSAYLAPEQLAGQPATAESDVYALGAILYTLLTGRSPPHRVAADTPGDVEAPSRPDPAWEFPAEAPPDIRHLVLSAVAADPHIRYVDGIDLAKAIAEERERLRSGSQDEPDTQYPEPEDDYVPRARQPALDGGHEPPAQARPPAVLPQRGSVGGTGAPGIVVLALVFIAFIVVLAGVGLSFFRSLNLMPITSTPFDRPTPAVPTVAAPTATPPAQSSPVPSPTPTLTGNEVLVPQLVGLNLEQAEPWLKERNLPYKIEEEHSDQYEAGEIISQFPLALQALRPGEQVELVVSLGPSEREVPAVVGLPVEEATKALESLKLRVVTEQAFSETAPPGVVLTQFPEAGTKVPAGATVRLFVNPESQPATIPNLVGQNFQEAGAVLG